MKNKIKIGALFNGNRERIMDLKKFRYFIILLIYPVITSSQESYVPKPRAITPPTATQFDQYNPTSAENNNGLLDISIPLYIINQDGVSIPISLNYNSQGIKVAEEASWVGLGWQMSFPTIYQNVNDLNDLSKDENYARYLPPHPGNVSPFIKELHFNPIRSANNSIFGSTELKTGMQVDERLHYYVATNEEIPIDGTIYNTEAYTYSPYSSKPANIFKTSGDIIDSEPDNFTIDLFGKKLYMIIDFETGEFQVLNEKLYKVEYIENESAFIITTPNEVKYEFRLHSLIFYQSQSDSFDFKTKDKIFQGENYQWFLTKIVTSLGSEIDFGYIDIKKNCSNLNDDAETYNRVSEKDYNFQLSGIVKAGGGEKDDANLRVGGPIEPVSRTVKGLYSNSYNKYYIVDRISFEEGYIEFDLSSREDVISPCYSEKLDAVKVFDSEGNKKYDYSFHYDYFRSMYNGSQWREVLIDQDILRLKLDKITFNGQFYRSFKYNSIVLPSKSSYAIDYWGFYNGKHNNDSYVPNPVRFTNANINDIPISIRNYNNGNNHSSNETFAKACILEQIEFPMGGREEFVYELNSYDSNVNNKVPNYNDASELVRGVGVRVKEIKSYSDASTSTAIHKKIVYEGGVLPNRLKYFKNFTAFYSNMYGDGYTPVIERKQYSGTLMSSSNLFDSPTYFNNDMVSYATISEINVSTMGENKNFKKVKKFSNPIFKYFSNVTDIMTRHYDVFSPGLINREEYRNGTLLKEEFYTEDGDLVKSNEYSYGFEKSKIYYGVKTGQISYWRWFPVGSGLQPLYVPRYSMTYYPIYYDVNTIINVIEQNYFDNGSKIQKNILKYRYDDNRRLKSMNHTIHSQMRYRTYEYPSVQNSSAFLKTTPILEYGNFNGGNKSVNYKYKKRIGYGRNQYVLEYEKHCLSGDCVYINYVGYDVKGNPTEISRTNGTPTVYLWGYNYTKMIAKIENATYIEVMSALGKQGYENLNYLQNYNESQIQSEIQKVRNGMPNSTVTTYTYIPLVGVSSITDPRGVKSYYTYDVFNRLEFIKDEKGNLLHQYKYHFKK